MSNELARRAVACKGWRWMPGMLVRYDEGHQWYRLRDGDGYGMPFKHVPPNPRHAWPDLTDPATLGCLLALVREAWDLPVAVWYPKGGGCCVGVGRMPIRPGRIWTRETKAEALVAALEAAP